MSIAAKFRRLANLYKLLWGLDELDQIASRTGAQLDALKSSLEVPPEMADEFLAWKSQNPIPSHPLVTVIVATYNRSRLLTERCIPSILGQTYANLELIPAEGASRLEPISPHQVPRPGSDEVSRTAASRLRKKGVHHKDTKAPRFRKSWFAWFLDKHFFVSL